MAKLAHNNHTCRKLAIRQFNCPKYFSESVIFVFGERNLGFWKRNLGCQERNLGFGKRTLGCQERNIGFWNRILGCLERNMGFGGRN